jgi:3-oxoacyl-(acyl-carrier-protein) synthase
MVAPSGVGGEACMKIALDMANKSAQGGRKVDYINTHGTSTPVGDAMELAAVKRTFVDGAQFANQFTIQVTCFTSARQHGARCCQAHLR